MAKKIRFDEFARGLRAECRIRPQWSVGNQAWVVTRYEWQFDYHRYGNPVGRLLPYGHPDPVFSTPEDAIAWARNQDREHLGLVI